MAAEREVIFEFIQIGAAVKVTAVDTESGIEVSIVGDPKVGETALKKLVRQKLDYVLAKRRGA